MSLNLLPPEIKTRHQARSKLYSVTVLYVVVGAILVLGWAAIVTYNFTLGGTIGEHETRIQQLRAQKGKSKDLVDKLSFIESRFSGAKQYQDQTDWNERLNLIAASVPSLVRLTNITMQPEESGTGHVFQLSGQTTDRRSIILFRDKLATEKSIQKVTLDSLTETVVGNGKEFTFTISLTMGAK